MWRSQTTTRFPVVVISDDQHLHQLASVLPSLLPVRITALAGSADALDLVAAYCPCVLLVDDPATAADVRASAPEADVAYMSLLHRTTSPTSGATPERFAN